MDEITPSLWPVIMTLIPKKDLIVVGEECFDADSKTGVDPQTHELGLSLLFSCPFLVSVIM